MVKCRNVVNCNENNFVMQICLIFFMQIIISYFFYDSDMFLIGFMRFTQGLYLTSNHLHIYWKTLICPIKIMVWWPAAYVLWNTLPEIGPEEMCIQSKK